MRFRAPTRASSSVASARPLATVLALVAMLVLAGCSTNAAPKPVAGSGATTSDVRPVGGFTSISASGGLNLVVASGDVAAVKVTAQSNLLPYVRTQVSNGQLSATILDPGITSDKAITVAVTIPRLTSLTLDGGVTGTMELTTDMLAVSLSGGATLQAIGSVTQLAVTAQGGAQARLGDLATDSATVTLGGGAQVTLHVKTAVTGSADGGATLTLTTKPASMTVTTNGGAVVGG